MQTITLNNGIQMPLLGYGVFRVAPEEAERCVSDALQVGYRMIDTAQAYNNEDGVGAAISKSGIKREDMNLIAPLNQQDTGFRDFADPNYLRKILGMFPNVGLE